MKLTFKFRFTECCSNRDADEVLTLSSSALAPVWARDETTAPVTIAIQRHSCNLYWQFCQRLLHVINVPLQINTKLIRRSEREVIVWPGGGRCTTTNAQTNFALNNMKNIYFHGWEVLLATNTSIWCGLSLDLSAHSSSTWYHSRELLLGRGVLSISFHCQTVKGISGKTLQMSIWLRSWLTAKNQFLDNFNEVI